MHVSRKDGTQKVMLPGIYPLHIQPWGSLLFWTLGQSTLREACRWSLCPSTILTLSPEGPAWASPLQEPPVKNRILTYATEHLSGELLCVHLCVCLTDLEVPGNEVELLIRTELVCHNRRLSDWKIRVLLNKYQQQKHFSIIFNPAKVFLWNNSRKTGLYAYLNTNTRSQR